MAQRQRKASANQPRNAQPPRGVLEIAIDRARKVFEEENIRLLTEAEISMFVLYHALGETQAIAVQLAMATPLKTHVARTIGTALLSDRKVRDDLRAAQAQIAAEGREDNADHGEMLADAYMRLARSAEAQGRIAEAKGCLDSVSKIRGVFTENRKVEFEGPLKLEAASNDEVLKHCAELTKMLHERL